MLIPIRYGKNTGKAKYVDMKVSNKYIGNVAKVKYFEKTVTNQN